MNELAELRERLCTLENRQRRLRGWCIASGALWVAACLAAVAAPSHDELRTRRLILVDEQGAERGTLATEADGAVLTLQSRDGTAGVQLAATTATWIEQRGAGFSFDSQGEFTSAPTTTKEEAGPWSGLVAWTGNEKSPQVTMLGAGPIHGLTVADPERNVTVGIDPDVGAATLRLKNVHSQTTLMAGREAAGLFAEAGDATWSVLNLAAWATGASVHGSFQDERDFHLQTTGEKAALQLRRGSEFADADEALPEVELGFEDDAGALVLRRGDTPTFRAPE